MFEFAADGVSMNGFLRKLHFCSIAAWYQIFPAPLASVRYVMQGGGGNCLNSAKGKRCAIKGEIKFLFYLSRCYDGG
jgi:hypothetical protein